jgi:hypothetical protein
MQLYIWYNVYVGLPILIYAHISALQGLFRRIFTTKSFTKKWPSKILKSTLLQLPYNSYSLNRTIISILGGQSDTFHLLSRCNSLHEIPRYRYITTALECYTSSLIHRIMKVKVAREVWLWLLPTYDSLDLIFNPSYYELLDSNSWNEIMNNFWGKSKSSLWWPII